MHSTSLVIVQHDGVPVYELIRLPQQTLALSDLRTVKEVAERLGEPYAVMDGAYYYKHYSKQRALERAMAVTTYNRPKPFSWSFSKLKNYETCPKRHYHVDVARDVQEPESEELKFGNMLHDAFAKRLGPHKLALPEAFRQYEPYAAKVDMPRDYPQGKLLVEQKLAIKRDYSPTEWRSNDAWYRGIADVLKIIGPVALLIDWKTGKVSEDSQQLVLAAACVFAHYPEVKRIRAEFVWLKYDATTREDIKREDMPMMWANLMPRIEELQAAAEKVIYPPKPGFLCRKWCPVKVCPHHGT